jgi:hypothetical protein
VDIELYKRTLEDAKAEMSLLLQQRRVTEERISKLAPVIEYLSPLCDELPSAPPGPLPSQLDMGLSDAIRLAFKSVLPASLTPTEVRDKLKESGFNLDKYANELPPIHNTIARLKEQGEIEEVVAPSGSKAYRWVSSLKRAMLELQPQVSLGIAETARLVLAANEKIKVDAMREVKKLQKNMGMDPAQVLLEHWFPKAKK